jgi:GrpB-like predicted nucleotidyltransferase (UPF0157 family)
MLATDSLQQAINEPVRIFPYDSSWPQKFEDEKNRLLGLFPGTFLAVEHIGSTAVPALSAKPIIDLMAGVRSMPEADAMLPRLCTNGYTTPAELNATLVDRRWLMRHSNGQRTHHLHLMIFDNEKWHEHLKFRELLKSDSEVFRQYQ